MYVSVVWVGGGYLQSPDEGVWTLEQILCLRTVVWVLGTHQDRL